MPISAISYYRGGAPETVRPLAQQMKAYWQNHGIEYRLARCHTGQVGHWMVVVRYPDWTTYAKLQDSFGQDSEYQQLVAAIGQVVTFVSRELVTEFDL